MKYVSAIKDNLPNRIAVEKYTWLDPGREKKLQKDPPIILDTSLDSDNAGDSIIMSFAEMQLKSIWPDFYFSRVTTHGHVAKLGVEAENRMKVLCGTNAIPMSINYAVPVSLPRNPEEYRKTVLLLGVGLRGLNRHAHITNKTAKVLRYLLSGDVVHSVRDSHTKRCLNEIGITNVVNTSCVTMWNLDSEHCEKLPQTKCKDVLTTITDYRHSPEFDSLMLQELKKHYRTVYIWIQGKNDLSVLKSMHVDGLKLITGGFNGLQNFISKRSDIDYFGTRLHCGIYCLNHSIRSMIVSVDNRASDIAVDTNLPIVARTDLGKDIECLIEEDRETRITIPVSEIQQWKEQFSSTR